MTDASSNAGSTEPSPSDDTSSTSNSTRSIELEIEVPGDPDEVWRAIATGPGISSWYVPHDVEERPGGALALSFGPGMDGTGRVAIWEPPHRVVFDNEDIAGLAFEWIVEATDGGSCIVKLVNSGFGSGADWDDQYDAMTNGWGFFLINLRLHLEHFAGRSATPSLPMAMWGGTGDEAWRRLLGDLGLPPRPEVGDRIGTTGDAPQLAGTVAHVGAGHLALVLDAPAPGTAFLATESMGGAVSVSVWSYLYGDDGEVAAVRDEPQWRSWLGERSDDAGATRT